MKEDIKEAWVAALRSGDYEQGEGTLQTEDGKFCCLGVLCDLAVREGVIQPWGPWQRDGVQTVFALDDDTEEMQHSILTAGVQTWAGLDDRNPDVPYGDYEIDDEMMQSLATLNDRGVTFAEIADLIEKNL